APKITQITHSNNILNGTLWDRGTDFWTAADDESKCLYCHGETKHSAVAAGYIASFQGANVIGGGLSGDWCASCHKKGSDNYGAMLTTLSNVPPEITGDDTYGNYPDGAGDGTNYYNHSLSDYNDSTCKGCHNSSSADITELMHSVLTGEAGGPDCVGCHDGTGSNNIDMTLFSQSPHLNINNGNATNNLQCYMCHRDGTAPTSEQGETEHNSGTIRSNATSKDCDDPACHGNTTSTENRFKIESHSPNASSEYVQTTGDCESCHSQLNVLIYNESNPGDSGNGSMALGSGPVEHYIRDIIDNATDEHYLIDSVGWASSPSAGCIYCHKTANGSVFGATQITHANDCYGCHIVGTTTLHERTVVSSGNGTADCLNCHGTDGARPDVNTSAFIQSEHGNLNSAALNDTILNFTQSKACWACHSNGTE
ncbi:MAG: hypothetical protein IH593_10060, partial [Bacteroidales bacterium]|nr:hypothetical protein [Bacteroidales bacterium]